MDQNRVLSDIVITTSDGLKLQAELGRPPESRGSAVVAHPHPLYGGTMHSPVVQCIFDALLAAGLSTVRFNFRGVGLSEGSYDDGSGEQQDVLAAIEVAATLNQDEADQDEADQDEADQVNVSTDSDHLSSPEVNVVLAGYSFGADVVLSCDDTRAIGWLAVAPPLQILPIEQMKARTSDNSTLIIAGTEDEFRNAADANRLTNTWVNGTVRPIEGASHFFDQSAHRQAIAKAVDDFVVGLVEPSN